MTHIWIHLCWVVLVSVVVAHGLPFGAPLSACEKVSPLGHVKKGRPNQLEKSDVKNFWSIRSGCYVIFPNDQMKMWVYDLGNGGDFKGLLLMVKDRDGNPVGSYTVDKGDPFKTIRCLNSKNSAVTHRNSKWKKPGAHRFTWTAPSSCERNSQYTIHAAVVKDLTPNYSGYQDGIKVNLVCRPDFHNASVMNWARPDHPSLYCAQVPQGHWAVIPRAASTSFEKPQPPIGWKHFYFGKEISLRRINDSTPTSGTGPLKAQDGIWYLYYEASGTDQGDMAGIYSPYGIQGCVCFSFWCHMNTDGTTRFTVSAIGPYSTTLLTTVEITNFWRQVQMSLISDYPIIIAIQVYRGFSYLGDVGIDNIELKRGKCPNRSIRTIDLYKIWQ